MSRIAILTSGTGAPGKNGVLRAVAAGAAAGGAELLGVRDGFTGLLEGRAEPVPAGAFDAAALAGGSVLGEGPSAAMRESGAPARAAERLKSLGVDALVVVGGDGTSAATLAMAKAGARVILVPATIEDDVRGTQACVGVDSAVNAILRRIEEFVAADAPGAAPVIVAVPGKFAGHLALLSATAVGAGAAILPERPFPWDRLGDVLARPGRTPVLLRAEGAGSGPDLEQRLLRLRPGVPPRILALGETARSAAPSFFDRVLGALFGEAAAAVALGAGPARMIVYGAGRCQSVPLEEVAGRRRQIPPEIFEIAKAGGVVFE